MQAVYIVIKPVGDHQMSPEQKSWPSATACSLSSIRDFSGNCVEREEKLIVAYTGYLATS